MSYGYCPQCGAPGITRERRINGNDKCGNGHIYPSIDALNKPMLVDSKYVAYATYNGKVFLFTSEDEFYQWQELACGRWSQAGWIDGVVKEPIKYMQKYYND